MPTLDQEQAAATTTFVPEALVYRSPEGWTMATRGAGQDEQVAVCWHQGQHFVRLNTKLPWFVFPQELSGAVLARAKELACQREETIRKGYEEMAADTAGEAEALEWSEALIGDGFEPYEG